MLLTLRVLLRGQGIGWECATQLPGDQLDRVWLQIGGGAMASAQILALEAAVEVGLRRPRLWPSRPRPAPLVRPWLPPSPTAFSPCSSCSSFPSCCPSSSCSG